MNDKLLQMIRALEAELEKSPADSRVMQKLFALHQKRGEPAEGNKMLLRLAKQHESDGFFLKAVAVLKQLLKLQPDHLEAHERLARVFLALGLGSDAVPHLAAQADAHAKLGDVERTLELHAQIAKIDPGWKLPPVN